MQVKFTFVTLMLSVALILGPGGHAGAESLEERLRLLEESYTELLIRDGEKSQEIERLRGQVHALQQGARDGETASEHAGHGHGAKTNEAGTGRAIAAQAEAVSQDDHGHGEAPDLFSMKVGSGRARLSGVFMDTAFAAGASTEKGETLHQLQGGDHDPRQNGFTLRTVDLSFAGGFDPVFDAFANMAFFIDPEGETRLELEEAFLQTQPGFFPLEVRAGQFFTEFGLLNPTHIHDQDFLDAPFMVSRFFGPDGMRGQGARVAWRSEGDTPFEILASVQNSQGETQASFRASDELIEEQPVGGLDFVETNVDGPEDFTYVVRASKVFGLGGEDRAVFGGSAAFGPNSSGPDGDTMIFGLHAGANLHMPGGGALRFQGEGLYRGFDVDPNNPATGFMNDDLEDWGVYLQGVYDTPGGFHFGLRTEIARGDGQSIDEFAGRGNDPFRSNRARVSPMVGWTIVPGLRLSAQYNHDIADFLVGDDAHSFWLGLNWSFGAGRRLELNAQNTALGAHNH